MSVATAWMEERLSVQSQYIIIFIKEAHGSLAVCAYHCKHDMMSQKTVTLHWIPGQVQQLVCYQDLKINRVLCYDILPVNLFISC